MIRSAAGISSPLPIKLVAAKIDGAFSVKDYLESYPDIAAADVNPFVHYLSAGRAEGRAALVVEPDAADVSGRCGNCEAAGDPDDATRAASAAMGGDV